METPISDETNPKSRLRTKGIILVVAVIVLLGAITAIVITNPGNILDSVRNSLSEEKVIAVVDGVPITDATLSERVAQVRADIETRGEVAPNPTDQQFLEQVLDILINEALVAQAATRVGVFAEDAQVAEQLAEIRARFNTEQEYEEELARSAYTKDTFEQYVERQLTAQLLVATQVPPDRLTPTDSEIEERYTLVTETVENPPPLAQVREQIESRLLQERISQILGALINQLRETADVNIEFSGVSKERIEESREKAREERKLTE